MLSELETVLGIGCDFLHILVFSVAQHLIKRSGSVMKYQRSCFRAPVRLHVGLCEVNMFLQPSYCQGMVADG